MLSLLSFCSLSVILTCGASVSHNGMDFKELVVHSLNHEREDLLHFKSGLLAEKNRMKHEMENLDRRIRSTDQSIVQVKEKLVRIMFNTYGHTELCGSHTIMEQQSPSMYQFHFDFIPNMYCRYDIATAFNNIGVITLVGCMSHAYRCLDSPKRLTLHLSRISKMDDIESLVALLGCDLNVMQRNVNGSYISMAQFNFHDSEERAAC
mmetsp:Transcript_2829/g.5309  ORF Transcript_2829/g.5309 Transcript_2829/m.5309 type:complete len:207 (+) Transcript_2829:43-663(+)